MQAVLEDAVAADEAVVGVVCNDANGLCLGRAGDTYGCRAAFLTSLVRRASLLDDEHMGSPMIVIESADKKMLLREYDSLTVAIMRKEAEEE
eukprot:CAMPEP_0118877462 /NCGR_PEP_ID=MMETSP1163-20130328/17751_1 /TAXON_ID=124430 /ORGANISM="Phaeomonas parva, Strain CCMP2877" /LENGTH=91 /DNA_ID=CAMNT_0006813175 /DNA_START=85 /DNA_END=360 /DNA_ORIENTATION=-